MKMKINRLVKRENKNNIDTVPDTWTLVCLIAKF